MGPMPQMNVTMIQITLLRLLISVRPTMLMTHSTHATGCRKIASRISTRSFINPPNNPELL